MLYQKGSSVIVFLIVIVVLIGVIIVGAIYIKNSGLLQKVNLLNNPQQNSENLSEEVIKETLVSKKLFTIPQDEKLLSRVVFSPDHQHFAYIVKTSEDLGSSEFYVVRDGKMGKKYGNIVAILRFSLDSKHLAYTAGSKDRKYYAVADETESKLYDGVYFPTFSPDGNRFAFIAKIGPIENQKSTVVVEGKEGKYYDSIVDSFEFSPDSNHIGYEVHQNNQEDFIVIDQKEDSKYDNVGNLIFSPDSKRYAYRATKDNKVFVVLDGQEGNKYDGINSLLFSSDGKQLVYKAKKLINGQEKGVLVRNGKESQLFDDVFPLDFSPDSTKLAYVVKEKGTTASVYINDKEIAKYNTLLGGTFSPDSERFAFTAVNKEGKAFAIVDNKEFSISPKSILTKFVFSPDSKHIAFVVQKEKNASIMLDGIEGKSFDYVSEPKFSEDSRNLIYNAKAGQDLWLIVDKVPE